MVSKDSRCSSAFLRNEFSCEGRWNFAIVKRQQIDLNGLALIAFSDTKPHDNHNTHKGVHFFVDDYRFESVYNTPERSLPKLGQYRFVLTPQFSCYAEMKMWRQIESIGKSRWCGAYWQSKGMKVIPSLCWSLYPSFEFCFDGIEKGSIVAVGTIGCRHGKTNFMRGYNYMLKKIDPEAIICFGKPFLEMKGNIIPVDYNTSRKVVR
jgi:hypothetical protein